MPDLTSLPSTDGLADDEYHIYSLTYAKNSARCVSDAFLLSPSLMGHDAHDGPLPTDYSIWIVRNARREFVVDLGFSLDSARLWKRELVHDPVEGLARIGIDPAELSDIVLSHMHIDHAGNVDRFPKATVHVQDTEVAFVTGRHMAEDHLRMVHALDDVLNIMRKNWSKQLRFHDGDSALFPGVSLHFLPGHAPGLQGTLVNTPRGKVLLASDGTHYYPNAYNLSPYRVIVSAPDSIASYRRMFELVDGPDYLIPGHDPKVRAIYPKLNVNGVELHALHEPPSETDVEFYRSVGNYEPDYPLDGE